MRLFLAIDLPDTTKQDLASELRSLQQEYADFRWVTPENYHITIHFFGEVAHSEPIIKKIEESIYDIPPLQLYSSEVGIFIKNKITLYLMFRREKNLERLAERIEVWSPFSSSRKFLPHITLGRYRIPSKQQYLLIKKKIQRLNPDIEFSVKKIHLFDSIQENGIPHYKKVASFELYK